MSKIAEALLLDTNTIRRHRSLYELGGIEELCQDSYSGRSPKLNMHEEVILCEELRSKIYLYTTEIIDYIRITFKVEYSQSGITKASANLNWHV